MKTGKPLDLTTLAGYHWHENGQSSFSGALLRLYRKLDHLFLTWAEAYQAVEYLFPTFIPARELGKLDYFRSFPHLVTFPVTLESSDENLKKFTGGEPLDAEGKIHLTQTTPICDVLTPAACYHFYMLFQGETLEAPRTVTTRATCFRRETQYAPLERQWSFSMREVVCLGTSEEVKAFLRSFQDSLDQFFKRIGLPIAWENATDPFFNPSRNPKYLAQKLDPVKTEMIFDGKLSIGSINFHRNYFGEAFKISREGKEAFSGCVAFGVERWIYAFLKRFGPDEEGWPEG